MLRATDRMFGFEGKEYEAYFWFTGWTHISFGLHVCLDGPNFEVHIPFGLIRIGRMPAFERRARAALSESPS